MHVCDNVHQTRELTYVIGRANACSHLWKFATWRFVCRGLTVLEKGKSKLQWGITSHESEWPSSKNLQTINDGEGVEKREPSCTVDGNVNWYSHYGEQYGGSQNTKNTTTIWSSNPTPGHISGENHNSKWYMHRNFHCSTIYNSQDMEAT